ncbi:MAG: NADH-quinone oxidoreductase subunit H [Asgard group archaeon]|nr:NADH-quinone oxidoreductase subunit H [Asgard group archaeon]
MDLSWFDIFLFPGFTFVIILTLFLEQIASRITNRFYFGEIQSPMFIPIVEQFKLITKGKKEKPTFRSILQGFILILMIVLPLFGSLILPISNFGELPGPVYGGVESKYSGVVGIINFEGDILLLFSIILIFNVLVFLVQVLGKNKSIKESISSTLKFLILDIPIFIALCSPILARGSFSLGILAEDIRWVVKNNLVFGLLILLPISTFIAIFALALKFDQPYFDRLNPDTEIGSSPPVNKNWRLVIWNLAIRLMEFLMIGIIVIIFLGGPHLPIPTFEKNYFIGYSLNFIFKCFIVITLSTIIKAVRPRLRLNQSVNYSLKFLTPIGLGSLLIIGIYIGVQGLN